MMARKLRSSRIFIVRTWTEELGDEKDELRGMVRDPQSGEVCYFLCWKDLIAFVATQVGAQESEGCQP